MFITKRTQSWPFSVSICKYRVLCGNLVIILHGCLFTVQYRYRSCILSIDHDHLIRSAASVDFFHHEKLGRTMCPQLPHRNNFTLN